MGEPPECEIEKLKTRVIALATVLYSCVKFHDNQLSDKGGVAKIGIKVLGAIPPGVTNDPKLKNQSLSNYAGYYLVFMCQVSEQISQVIREEKQKYGSEVSRGNPPPSLEASMI